MQKLLRCHRARSALINRPGDVSDSGGALSHPDRSISDEIDDSRFEATTAVCRPRAAPRISPQRRAIALIWTHRRPSARTPAGRGINNTTYGRAICLIRLRVSSKMWARSAPLCGPSCASNGKASSRGMRRRRRRRHLDWKISGGNGICQRPSSAAGGHHSST